MAALKHLPTSVLFCLAAAAVLMLAAQGARAECNVQKPEQKECDWAQLGRFRAANAALPAPIAASPRVVLMGDSITEGWPESKDGAEMGSLFPGKPYVNRGISGQTTPQMLVRFREDVIALKPAVVVILAGTNDIAGNTGEASLEEIEGYLTSMCELARANGIRVVLASVLPALDYPWRPGRQPAPKIAALNAWMKGYATAGKHTYLEFFTPMATPAGALKPEYHDGDGVHPNRAGYAAMAPLLQKAVEGSLARP
jgi:lysophospholipase L1-like esterase